VLSILLAACGGGSTTSLDLQQTSTPSSRLSDAHGAEPSPVVIEPTPTPTLMPSRTHFASAPKKPAPVVYLDPGHGGVDTGTQGYTSSGQVVDEKTVVLQIALRTAALLRQDGITVVMTRTTDADPCAIPSDLTADGTELTAEGVLNDLQCRINKANAAHADVFLSIHMDAFQDPSIGGTETFYDPDRPFGAENAKLAQLIQSHVLNELHQAGYTTTDRGITNDTQLQAESMGAMPSSYDHLVLLGPGVPGLLTPSQMPGALCEVFFLSDPSEADAVVQPSVQNLVATGFALAIEQFLVANGKG